MTLNGKLHFADLPARLLDWYSRAARDLPWRVGPADRARGVKADPYRVWLAEIMLQQTTVPHATRYYLEFVSRWPSVNDLANADDDAVMAAWAGLGYYARARNLLKCARLVAAQGAWPETETDLKKLPGIGPYTAGAVAALAFGRPTAAVDGNVDRVFARLMALKGDWSREKAKIRPAVEALVPEEYPAEFAEALMDLGATICTPKSPNCLICPVNDMCAARAEGDPARYPIKPKKAENPIRHGHVFVVRDLAGNILTERRPARGLLGGMLGLPTSDWNALPAVAAFPVEATWQNSGEVHHVFTHFRLILKVWAGQIETVEDWTRPKSAAEGLPSVFAKALSLALTPDR